MTLSPEEDVRAIIRKMSLEGGWGWQVSESEEEKLIALIAAAIREAENEALERAATTADETQTFEWRGGDEWAAGYHDGKNVAAQRIRALIKKD